jgi:predicted permease
MRSVAAPLRQAVRALARTPSFTVAVVAVLALGIGATTAMFSVVYGVLLRPLPFDEPDRLVRLWTAWKPALGRGAVSAANWRDWRAQNRTLVDVALIRNNQSFNLTTHGQPERLEGASVSTGFFPVLRAVPRLGRTFAAGEDEEGRDGVVVLSHALWVRRFGGDPSIVGRTIPLNGVPTTVVGVMPSDFRYPTRDVELWTPLAVPADEYGHRTWGSYSAVARLRPGVSLARARADLHVVSANLARQYPDANGSVEVGLAPLLDDIARDVRRPLLVLLGAVGTMLLVGCANVASLLLARAVARRREFAVHAALGASRRRLVARAVAELVPLLALGGALGVSAAWAILRALAPLLPRDIPRVEEIGIHAPVLGFTAALLALVAVLAGIWPALDAARRGLQSTMAELSRGATDAPRRVIARDLLVVGQIATTLVLLVGAAVLGRSFLAARQVRPGFVPEHVLSAQLPIPRAKYPLDRDVAAVESRVLERVRALPGVVAVGLVSRLPLGGSNQTGSLEMEGAEPGAGRPGVQTRTASPEYFRALGIPLRAGRAFAPSDGVDAPPVAVVDERFARAQWPGASALGRRLRESSDDPWSTVVGVVGHVRHTGLDEDTEEPQVYWNYTRRAEDRVALVVRTRGDPAALTRALAAAVRAVDPDQPIYDAFPLDAVVDRSLGQRRLQSTLLGTFAVMALALASVGVYGVIAYGVGLRRREFGVRVALGARRADVFALVLRRGVALFCAGAGAGLALAAAGVRVLSTLVFGVAPHDAPSFAAATLVLLVVSLTACGVPARRAARVEPTTALRAE